MDLKKLNIDGGDDGVVVVVHPKEHRGKMEIVPLVRSETSGIRFIYSHFTYILQPASATDKAVEATFTPLPYPSSLRPALSTFATPKGLTTEEVTNLRALFGPNSLPIPIPSFLVLFGEHATAPFFVFQVSSLFLFNVSKSHIHSRYFASVYGF
jgi:cation-transporting ATPase 13A1